MARSLFGGTSADGVYSVFAFAGRELLALASATLTFWTAETGGTRHTDLLNAGGAAVSAITTTPGQVPAFSGPPDGVTEMWADDGDTQRVLMIAQGRQGPVGPTGETGAPGGSDASFASFVSTDGTATNTALAATFALFQEAPRALSRWAVANAVGDQTALIQQAITDIATQGGGTLFVDGYFRADGQLTIPTTSGAGTTNPKGKSVRITGLSPAPTLGHPAPQDAGPSVLDLRYAGANGKILALNQMVLEIDHITLTDRGTAAAPAPFVYTTHAVLRAHDNSIFGHQLRTLCDQDVFVLGGSAATAYDDGVNSAFAGYGTEIHNNYFSGVRRLVYLRASCNSIKVRGNWANQDCGTNLVDGAAIELNPGAGGGLNITYGNVISDNTIEMQGYVYGCKAMNTSQYNTFRDNSFWDRLALTEYDYYFGTGAQKNLITGGGVTDTTKHRLFETDAGSNMIIGTDRNMPTSKGGLGLWNGDTLGWWSADGTVFYHILRLSGPTTTLGDIDLLTGGSVTLQGNTTGGLQLRLGNSTSWLTLSTLGRIEALKPFRPQNVASASRPTHTASGPGGIIYDTTLGRHMWSDTTTWRELHHGYSATATLNFPSVAAAGSQELTVTVTGAAVGDRVSVGPPAAIEAGLVWNGFVSATNTVKVRVSNITASPIDPASATWGVAVIK